MGKLASLKLTRTDSTGDSTGDGCTVADWLMVLILVFRGFFWSINKNDQNKSLVHLQ